MRKKMLNNSKIVLMLLLVAVVVSSCKPSVPEKYIQPDDMEDILYEYHLSQSLATVKMNTDSVAYYKNMYYRSILENHGVTEAEFDSSLVYYYTHAYRLHDIYRNISERMNDEVENYGAAAGEIGKYTQFTTEGDTANIWSEVSSTILIPKPTVNRFDFEIKADSTYQRGDSFLFNLMSTFLYQSGTKDAMLYLAVQYEDDSVYTQTRRMSVTGLTQINIRAYNESDVKCIKGFIYLHQGNDDSNTLKLLFVDKIQLIRFHPKVPVDTTKFAKPDLIKADSLVTDTLKVGVAFSDSLKRDSIKNILRSANNASNKAANEKLQMRKPLKMSDVRKRNFNGAR